MVAFPPPFGLTPSLSRACSPPAGCWSHTNGEMKLFEVVLTWDAPMDDTSTPANVSWTLLLDGVPTAVDTQTWQGNTTLHIANTATAAPPAVVTLSYAGDDPGLRIPSGSIVQAFDLGGIDECV